MILESSIIHIFYVEMGLLFHYNFSMEKGSLIILSGPSGVGKGTVRQALLSLGGVDFYYSVSMTTRKPRPGEVDGRDYIFVSPEEFQRNIDNGNLLEWAEFVGNRYGTPRDIIEQWRDKGRDVLLEIETNGAKQVLAKCPDAISIFIVPPNFEALESRIRGRSTEDEPTIQRRLAKARAELLLQDNYQYKVLNDTPLRAAEEIKSLILSSHK